VGEEAHGGRIITNLIQVPWDKVKDRDARYGVDTMKKREVRKEIEEHKTHPDADACWKPSRQGNY
jgi:hypothetical protein